MTGRFADAAAGHDRDTAYVIVREEGDFVYLCDGRKRGMAHPKKKRKKHVRIHGDTVQPELLHRLRNGGRVRDEEIKYALKQRRNQQG